jgi:hypothetical protein
MHRLVLLLLVTPAFADPPADPGAAKQKGLTLLTALDKVTFTTDDDIKLAFVLKNETGKDLFVGDGFLAPAYQEAGPGRHFEVHLADGKDSYHFWSGTATEGRASGVRKVFRLKPGESYKGSIWLRRPAPKQGEERGGSFENRRTNKQHALGKDGTKYTVVLRYQLNENYGVWQPPADYRAELLWTGVVSSKPLAFEVSDK